MSADPLSFSRGHQAWAHLGLMLGHLGLALVRLGNSLGHVWLSAFILGSRWVNLPYLWPMLVKSAWLIFGSSWVHVGPSWVIFGSRWGDLHHLGHMLGHLIWLALGHLGSSSVHLDSSWAQVGPTWLIPGASRSHLGSSTSCLLARHFSTHER